MSPRQQYFIVLAAPIDVCPIALRPLIDDVWQDPDLTAVVAKRFASAANGAMWNRNPSRTTKDPHESGPFDSIDFDEPCAIIERFAPLR